jgi:hypothetical protein
MKFAEYQLFSASALFLIGIGCSSDGMIEPGKSSQDLGASAALQEWSGPVNLTAVNSSFTEQHPALSKDGLSLYFVSNRSGNQNIWVARWACNAEGDECTWRDPMMLGEAVNSSSLDAAPALSRDGHQLFFISQRGGDAPRWPGDTCTTASCDRDLWVSYRADVHNDSGWEPAVNLGPPVNTNDEEIAPSYFENDDSGLPQLFFNDGVLNTATPPVPVLGDIYMSQSASDGTWSSPSPVIELNTPCSDQRPSISHDGRALYFHSTRPISPPGECASQARLWVATRQQVSDAWSAPTLVPSPISDVQTIHPLIHSHGNSTSLLFVRGGDIWMSELTTIDLSQPKPGS